MQARSTTKWGLKDFEKKKGKRKRKKGERHAPLLTKINERLNRMPTFPRANKIIYRINTRFGVYLLSLHALV